MNRSNDDLSQITIAGGRSKNVKIKFIITEVPENKLKSKLRSIKLKKLKIDWIFKTIDKTID